MKANVVLLVAVRVQVGLDERVNELPQDRVKAVCEQAAKSAMSVRIQHKEEGSAAEFDIVHWRAVEEVGVTF